MNMRLYVKRNIIVNSLVILNAFIANIKQGVGPQVFSTLVMALSLQYVYMQIGKNISIRTK